MYFRFLRNISLYQPFLEKDIMDVVEEWEDNLIIEASICLETNLQSVENLREDIHTKVYEIRLNELRNHKRELEKHKKVRKRRML